MSVISGDNWQPQLFRQLDNAGNPFVFVNLQLGQFFINFRLVFKIIDELSIFMPLNFQIIITCTKSFSVPSCHILSFIKITINYCLSDLTFWTGGDGNKSLGMSL